MWLSVATQRHMPLHGPGQRIYWLPDKFYTPVRKRKRKREEEIFIQQFKENIAQGNIEQDIPNDQEEIFVPNKRARHRVPKHSLRQIQHQKKKTKSAQCSENNK